MTNISYKIPQLGEAELQYKAFTQIDSIRLVERLCELDNLNKSLDEYVGVEYWYVYLDGEYYYSGGLDQPWFHVPLGVMQNIYPPAGKVDPYKYNIGGQ